MSTCRDTQRPTLFTVSPQQKSAHRYLCLWCHEIHLQDLSNLARVGGHNCHEQCLLELELVSVTDDNSDQRHPTSMDEDTWHNNLCTMKPRPSWPIDKMPD